MSDEILAAADANMREVWRRVVAAGPSPGLVDAEGLVLMSSGVPVPLFNPSFVVHPPADPTAAVARLTEHYAAINLPFSLHFRDAVAPGLSQACESAGLVEHWKAPLMVLDPTPTTAPAPPAGLTVARLDASNLEAYASVLAAGFHMPRALVDVLFGPPLLDLAGFTGFVGTLDGQPVSTSGLFSFGGVAGVYNVATIPEARGKGVGAALTWAAARAGAEAGETVSILQASQAGEPVYRRMGYTTPVRYRQFVAP